jgi:hypothetical protein
MAFLAGLHYPLLVAIVHSVQNTEGLVRDFYAKRVECYVHQLAVDLPAVKPTNTSCKVDGAVSDSYLQNYPKSLGSGGIHPPTHWPYNTSSLAAARTWCCAAGHTDCGGVTFQDGRYEVRAGSNPVPSPAGSGTPTSYPRANAGRLNTVNLTQCVVTAELDFTQGVGTTYADVPTAANTMAISSTLVGKYSEYFL